MIRKYADIFCWKNVSSFCNAKATHIFSTKNFRILYIESAKTVNEMTLNELVKLTTLWTTGPCSYLLEQISVDFHQTWSVDMRIHIVEVCYTLANWQLLLVFLCKWPSWVDTSLNPYSSVFDEEKKNINPWPIPDNPCFYTCLLHNLFVPIFGYCQSSSFVYLFPIWLHPYRPNQAH